MKNIERRINNLEQAINIEDELTTLEVVLIKPSEEAGKSPVACGKITIHVQNNRSKRI